MFHAPAAGGRGERRPPYPASVRQPSLLHGALGGNAVGGEALMPLVPLIVWTLILSGKELFKEDEEQ